jgi:hypothetical protein
MLTHKMDGGGDWTRRCGNATAFWHKSLSRMPTGRCERSLSSMPAAGRPLRPERFPTDPRSEAMAAPSGILMRRCNLLLPADRNSPHPSHARIGDTLNMHFISRKS